MTPQSIDVRRSALGLLSGLLAVGITVLSPTAQPVQAQAVQAQPVLAQPGLATVSPLRAAGVDNWWFDVLELAAAHKQTTGEGVTVALIDDAIDLSVPELKGAQITLKRDCEGKPSRSVQGSGSDHGTAMATTILGNGRGNAPGGLGVLGVAPGVDLMFYGHDPDLSTSQIECYGREIGRTMVRAAKDGADIISLSASMDMGVAPYVERVLAMDVLVVASVGDAESNGAYPAAVPGVVSVLAVDEQGQPWDENDRVGYSVISSPGVSAPVGGTLPDGSWLSGAERTGTSAATALVSGALALAKSKHPEASNNQLIQQLIHYPVGSGGYAWDKSYGFGIVSVSNLLRHDPTEWPDENPLLEGPQRALKAFPMSVRGQTNEQDDGSPSPSAETSPTESDSPATDASDATGASKTADASDGGVSPWVWAAGAAVVLLGLGAAFGLSKRGPRAGANDKAQGVSHDRS